MSVINKSFLEEIVGALDNIEMVQIVFNKQ